MQLLSRLLLAVLLPSSPVAPVTATIDTTLESAGNHIRQLAFDGEPDSYFASAENPTAADHFTLVFDRPVAVKSVAVTTGRPGGGDRLDAGALEVSGDGKRFDPVAKFAGGAARARLDGRRVRAIRVRPADDLKHPLAIREFVIESEPAVAVFRYPVEFLVDVSDAPEMKDWAEKAARVCTRAYPMINEELKSAGFRPPRLVRLALRKKYRGVAATAGDRIVGSVTYFKAHPGDVGAMVHETVHVVQNYRTPNNPWWLVEGIADYIRFFKYEPGRLGPLNPGRARYDGGYRETAAFLAYLTEKYDRQIVRKLNKMMREGEYRQEAFKALTGKTVRELGREWRVSLRRGG